jgi:hypothetical protein
LRYGFATTIDATKVFYTKEFSSINRNQSYCRIALSQYQIFFAPEARPPSQDPSNHKLIPKK